MNIELGKRLISVVEVVLLLFVMNIQLVGAQEHLGEEESEEEIEIDIVLEEPSGSQDQECGEDVESKINKWWLYGGAAALGVGVLALASGSSSSSSSASCDEESVGPDIAGADWAGTLTIRASGYEGKQSVTATITHCGSDIIISTSSTLSYGAAFDGTTDSSGNLLLVEQVMSQDWTTHYGAATTTSIKLYDFVNEYEDFDILELSRTVSTN